MARLHDMANLTTKPSDLAPYGLAFLEEMVAADAPANLIRALKDALLVRVQGHLPLARTKEYGSHKVIWLPFQYHPDLVRPLTAAIREHSNGFSSAEILKLNFYEIPQFRFAWSTGRKSLSGLVQRDIYQSERRVRR